MMVHIYTYTPTNSNYIGEDSFAVRIVDSATGLIRLQNVDVNINVGQKLDDINTTSSYYQQSQVILNGKYSFVYTSDQQHATYQGYKVNTDLSNGLVGVYMFNGNTNDESGNGFHAQNSGASLTTDRFGNTSSAYHFDGLDYMKIANQPQFNSQTQTISAWYKPTTSFHGDGGNVIVSKPYLGHVAPYYQWHLGVRADGYWGNGQFGFQFVTPQSSNSHFDINSSEIINNWVNVVGVTDANYTSMSVNGLKWLYFSGQIL